eukprot:scaffold75330_cov48-Prasinocladus_malaysianus.AAC.2
MLCRAEAEHEEANLATLYLLVLSALSAFVVQRGPQFCVAHCEISQFSYKMSARHCRHLTAALRWTLQRQSQSCSLGIHGKLSDSLTSRIDGRLFGSAVIIAAIMSLSSCEYGFVPSGPVIGG